MMRKTRVLATPISCVFPQLLQHHPDKHANVSPGELMRYMALWVDVLKGSRCPWSSQILGVPRGRLNQEVKE